MGDRVLNLGTPMIPETQILLRHTDVLVTDYSSIWVDYLLTGRPMIAFVYDQRAYQSERGLLYDYDHIFPGPIVESYAGLLAAVEDALLGKASGEEIARRAATTRMFHRFTDGDASRRVCEAILNVLDG